MKKILAFFQSIKKKLSDPVYCFFACLICFFIGYALAPINVYAQSSATKWVVVDDYGTSYDEYKNGTFFFGQPHDVCNQIRIIRGSPWMDGCSTISVDSISAWIRISQVVTLRDYHQLCSSPHSHSDQQYCAQPEPPPDFRFPPGSPFCIDNPESPLCVDEVPDGCNIGLGTGDCCTAFATNQCAGNGGVYWVNFTSGDFGESCTYECWGDQHNHPPEPEPGNHPGFPDRQSCQTFANNHCNGSGNVHMLFYNEDTKTCSVTCSDGRGGTSPDPTVPIPGTNPGQTPTPGESTDLGVQRAIQRFHNDSIRQWDRQNFSNDQIEMWIKAGLWDHENAVPRLATIEDLLGEIRDKPTPGFDGELTIPGFDNLPGDFGDLDHDGDGMRGIGDGLGLDGDTTFDDIPERIIDISDYMGNFDLPSSGSCPTSFPVPLFGQVYNLDTSHMCRILEIVSIFLMMSAYVLSLRIVYGGLR